MTDVQGILRWYDNMNNIVPTWHLKSYEVWDVLDVDGNKTGHYHERGKPMNNGEHHLEVSVWIENDKGEHPFYILDEQNSSSNLSWSFVHNFKYSAGV